MQRQLHTHAHTQYTFAALLLGGFLCTSLYTAHRLIVVRSVSRPVGLTFGLAACLAVGRSFVRAVVRVLTRSFILSRYDVASFVPAIYVRCCQCVCLCVYVTCLCMYMFRIQLPTALPACRLTLAVASPARRLTNTRTTSYNFAAQQRSCLLFALQLYGYI